MREKFKHKTTKINVDYKVLVLLIKLLFLSNIIDYIEFEISTPHEWPFELFEASVTKKKVTILIQKQEMIKMYGV